MEQLSQNQIREFKNAFDLFDKDRDGVVSRQDLESTLAALGMNLSSGVVRDMMEECDTSRTGKINFTEFLTVLSSKLRNTDPEETVRKAFETLDPEKKGYIPASELRRDLMDWGRPLTEDEMRSMLKEVGCAESGLFEYEKFISALFMKSD